MYSPKVNVGGSRKSNVSAAMTEGQAVERYSFYHVHYEGHDMQLKCYIALFSKT